MIFEIDRPYVLPYKNPYKNDAEQYNLVVILEGSFR